MCTIMSIGTLAPMGVKVIFVFEFVFRTIGIFVLSEPLLLGVPVHDVCSRVDSGSSWCRLDLIVVM